ncbi:hypothetical protein [Rhizosphaericola mali]|uniref:Uncharacterized protein n=1 Tax=Rhizosphaericola mali TaxID=2545455 RepID=A0A5P2FZC4_9BACT|nr:hypothetical protein [Rhizosphaericola mali]QES88876.1 hypothetical protein E0W69_009480 [Rhizosphaericola mali]
MAISFPDIVEHNNPDLPVVAAKSVAGLDVAIAEKTNSKVDTAQIGISGGVASLDTSKKLLQENLPVTVVQTTNGKVAVALIPLDQILSDDSGFTNNSSSIGVSQVAASVLKGLIDTVTTQANTLQGNAEKIGNKANSYDASTAQNNVSDYASISALYDALSQLSVSAQGNFNGFVASSDETIVSAPTSNAFKIFINNTNGAVTLTNYGAVSVPANSIGFVNYDLATTTWTLGGSYGTTPYSSQLSVLTNEEFIYAIVDGGGNLLWGKRWDGTTYDSDTTNEDDIASSKKRISTVETTVNDSAAINNISTVQNGEYIYSLVDGVGNFLWGIRWDGSINSSIPASVWADPVGRGSVVVSSNGKILSERTNTGKLQENVGIVTKDIEATTVHVRDSLNFSDNALDNLKDQLIGLGFKIENNL